MTKFRCEWWDVNMLVLRVMLTVLNVVPIDKTVLSNKIYVYVQHFRKEGIIVLVLSKWSSDIRSLFRTYIWWLHALSTSSSNIYFTWYVHILVHYYYINLLFQTVWELIGFLQNVHHISCECSVFWTPSQPSSSSLSPCTVIRCYGGWKHLPSIAVWCPKLTACSVTR